MGVRMEKKRERKSGAGAGAGAGARAEIEGGVGFHILDLPLHILSDIIVKLPPSSVVRCASVCTALRHLVSDSRFHRLYLSRAPTSFVVLSDHGRLLSLDSCADYAPHPSHHHDASSTLACFHIHSSHIRNPNPNAAPGWSWSRSRPRSTPTSTSTFIALHALGRMNLVNSSHGLLCLRASGYPSLYYVCNPLLGEILTLPPPPTPSSRYLRFSAFGIDPISKRYKILQLVMRSNHKMVAELYQLGDEKWKVIGNAASSATARPNSAFDPSLNGALHWVTADGTRISELICSFDLHTNEFKSVAPPSHFDADYVNKMSGISIGVLKGCLCLCYVNGDSKFETWLMQEYGVQESWTKIFSIDIKSYCGLRLEDKHRPIGFTTFGEMWLKADSDSGSDSHCLVSYSAERGAFKVIDIEGTSSNMEATPHVFSFVSLKDIVNVSNAHLRFHRLRPKRN